MDGFNFIQAFGLDFICVSRFHPCESKDFIKKCPTRLHFPVGHFAFLGTIFHYKSLELWGYRWIYGVIVRLMGLSLDLWAIVEFVGYRGIIDFSIMLRYTY